MLAELTLFDVTFRCLETPDEELKSAYLCAEVGVESSVGMLRLRLTEDSLHNDKLFLLINFEWGCILIEPILILCNAVSEQKYSQFRLLLFVVVRRDLIEPKSDGLGFILLTLCSYQCTFGCFS